MKNIFCKIWGGVKWFVCTIYGFYIIRGVVSDFAKKHPEEFDKIVKSLYIDKIISWMSKLMENEKRRSNRKG